MNAEIWWNPASALLDRGFAGLVGLVIALLLVAPVVIALVPGDRKELWDRYRSWLVLATAVVLPLVLGPGATVIAIGVLSLLCYREFARFTGLFRARRLSVVVTAGVLGLVLAALGGSFEGFVGLSMLMAVVIAVTSFTASEESGYLQRTALALLGWTLIVWLSHLGLFAELANYRSVLLWLVLCVELNDVFAFVCGKLVGGRKLCPRISPNKTAAGAFGALLATTALAVLSGQAVFPGESLWALVLLGMVISSTGQLGDLMVSAIKRDIGIKDTSNLIPGHGGCLDRFDSLLLAAPAVFYVLQLGGGILT
jgi:phosphatidate cytidylyltransferase